MPLNDHATRLTSRVAPYLEAIAKAREGGLTWRDLGRLFGVSDRRLRWAVSHCKYTAEQVPLPAPAPAQPAATVMHTAQGVRQAQAPRPRITTPADIRQARDSIDIDDYK